MLSKQFGIDHAQKARLMRFALFSLGSLLLSGVCAANEVISVALDRQHDAKPVVISALLQMAPQPNGKALFVFPGWPGIPRIETKDGAPAYLYLQEHVEKMRPALHAAGISIATMDCPTDQWGARGANPTACDDSYRSSELHAKDVAALLQKIKSSKALDHIVIMGHSYGAISSHWLSVWLGPQDIQGAIHSATQSVAGGGPYTAYAASMARFNHAQAKVPYLYLHHQNDLCKFTPYSHARQNAQPGMLMTVVGGNRWSDPCGKASYHSYSERTDPLAEALIAFLNRAQVTPLIQGPGD